MSTNSIQPFEADRLGAVSVDVDTYDPQTGASQDLTMVTVAV